MRYTPSLLNLWISYRPTAEKHMRTFDELSAVIRLAHKYHVQQLLDQTLASLHAYGFVSSFSAYARLPPDADLALDASHSIGIVNLARLTDTPALLPLALYRCAYLDGGVLDGCARADVTRGPRGASAMRCTTTAGTPRGECRPRR